MLILNPERILIAFGVAAGLALATFAVCMFALALLSAFTDRACRGEDVPAPCPPQPTQYSQGPAHPSVVGYAGGPLQRGARGLSKHYQRFGVPKPPEKR